MIRTIIFIIVFIAMHAMVHAGGFFVSDTAMPVQQPDQKAVLHFDGNRQVAVLASGLKSDELANYAWIIPVFSGSKPVVKPSGMRAHEISSGFFSDKRKNINRKRSFFGEGLLDSRPVDIYDLAIIKPAGIAEFAGILEAEGYRATADDLAIAGEYIARGAYFIINRINLRQKFRKEIDEATVIYDNVKNEYNNLLRDIRNIFTGEEFNDKRYGGKALDSIVIDYLKTWSPRKNRPKPGFYWLEDYYNRIINWEFKKNKLQSRVVFLLNDDTLRLEGNPSLGISLVEGKIKLKILYEFSIMKYGWNKGRISINNYSPEENSVYINDSNLDKYTADIKQHGKVRGLNERDIRSILAFLEGKDFDYSDLLMQLEERVKIITEGVIPGILSMEEKYIDTLSGLFERIDDYNAKPQIYERKFYAEDYEAGLKEKVRSLVNASSISMKAREKFSELAHILSALEEGLSTPLEIESFVKEPFYPLAMSSVNNGECRIEVFLLSKGQAFDRKDVLWKDSKVAVLNENSRKAFSGIFDMKDTKYISWFSQVGNLKEIKKDVIFTIEDK